VAVLGFGSTIDDAIWDMYENLDLVLWANSVVRCAACPDTFPCDFGIETIGSFAPGATLQQVTYADGSTAWIVSGSYTGRFVISCLEC